MSFHQDPPAPPSNTYLADPILRDYLARVLPEDVVDEVEPGLSELGERAGGQLRDWADDAEANPPELIRYGPWGRRVDRLDLADGWSRLQEAGVELGLVADAYDRPVGEHSRVLQAAKIHLFHPSSAVATCPLAMTDGAARVAAGQADEAEDPSRLHDAFERLTSDDPGEAWTAGQWMTERSGGSDVSGTETVARHDGDAWRLYGHKWFASAIDADVAFTLARIEDDEGELVEGADGLGLFFVKLRDDDGDLQAIRIERLKDKLGTEALPTAELELDGTPAVPVGRRGEGVQRIATILNVTRTWNALCSAAQMRRVLDLAEDYAQRRSAFGTTLSDLPLHVDVLADLETRAAAGFHLAFETARLLGKVESQTASPSEGHALRLLTPIVKLLTAKQTIEVTSEALECFGGAGYVEDSGIPRFLRDAQVLSIWEGTTNVLSLDAVQVIDQLQAHDPVLDMVADRIDAAELSELEDAVQTVDAAVLRLQEHVAGLPKRDEHDVEAGARRLALTLGRVVAASLLIEHAEATGKRRDVALARRWCRRNLTDLKAPGKRDRESSERIAFG